MFVNEDRSTGPTRRVSMVVVRCLNLGYGRFLQPDPIGYDDGLNWYNYAGDDPVNFIDPSGTKYVCPDKNPDNCYWEVEGSKSSTPLQFTSITLPGSPEGSLTIGDRPQNDLVCKGTATFSAVGPLPQAAGDSAFAPGTRTR